MAGVIAGDLVVEQLVTDDFLFDLHHRLYRDVWQWAGRRSTRERSLGIAPELIAVELRSSLANILYRWDHTDDWDPQALGLVVHAEATRVHPFVDGNGRATRMLADLVFVAAQRGSTLYLYDWAVDKPSYITALRQYDASRDIAPLVRLIPLAPIE